MKTIPAPSKRRLVLLGQLLAGYKEKTITSQKIEEMAGWSAAVIRRDISLLEIRCGASNGYRVTELKSALKDAISSSENEKKCCLVGLGKLGQSWLQNNELKDTQFKITAGFDSNVNRTEVLRSDFPLHPVTELESVIQKEGIKFAILACSSEEAQALASRLCQCGIKGIVNFTPCVLTVPKTTAVENVSLLTSLEIVSLRSKNS